jgi:hypothetical protein
MRYLLTEVLLHEEKRREQENHTDEVRHYDFPISDTFPHVVRTSVNR